MTVFSPLALRALSPLPAQTETPTAKISDAAAGPSFGQTLQNALGTVNDLQNQSGAMAREFAVGQTSDIHSVMIAAEKATVALQMTTQVRNKAVEAYQEIMRITL